MTAVVTAGEALQLGPGERAVVVHVDDLGMCRDANAGALDAMAVTATSGSVMVPCPAFGEIAELARARPELDLGVHLTLNCEYERYRWGPVLRDVRSLCAPDGGLWRTSEETAEHASLDDVRRELSAQVERALEEGIDVTHVDAHMGTALRLEFAEVYLDVAQEFRLPAFIPRVDRAILAALGRADDWEAYRVLLSRAERAGFPLFDHFDLNSLAFEPGTGYDHNRARIEQLRPGVSYLITHCARGGPELQSISPDWRQRAEEHRLYSDGSLGRVFESGGIRRIGMRALRDWFRRTR